MGRLRFNSAEVEGSRRTRSSKGFLPVITSVFVPIEEAYRALLCSQANTIEWIDFHQIPEVFSAQDQVHRVKRDRYVFLDLFKDSPNVTLHLFQHGIILEVLKAQQSEVLAHTRQFPVPELEAIIPLPDSKTSCQWLSSGSSSA
jgi:hypothetical protein